MPDLSAWQITLDAAEAELNVGEVMRLLLAGNGEAAAHHLGEFFRRTAAQEWQGIGSLLRRLLIPALVWAVIRRISGGGQAGGAAELTCYLICSGVVLKEFSRALEIASDTARRIAGVSGQVFPVLTALMSASGAAGWMQLPVSWCGGVLSSFVQRLMQVLGGSAAVLAVIGNLTERLSLESLFKLCCRVGNWLLSGVMMVFGGLIALGGVMGAAQEGMAMRAAKYAAGSLLPVVGGDIAGTLDSMVYSASLVHRAAGVTGCAVMLAVCVRPLVCLALSMLAHMLTAALTEPLADGALNRCIAQMGAVIRFLMAASLVSAALFIMLTGAFLSVAGA